MNFTNGYTFSFVFCLQFLLTSFLLISTKYLTNLIIYSAFFWGIIFYRPCFPGTVVSFEYMFLGCLFLDPRFITHHSKTYVPYYMSNQIMYIYFIIQYIYIYMHSLCKGSFTLSGVNVDKVIVYCFHLHQCFTCQ